MERSLGHGRFAVVRILPFLPLCLMLVACSNEGTPKAFDPEAKAREQAAKERAAVKAGFAPPAPAPLATVSVDPPKTDTPGSMLPPADRQYRYIGRWAATPASCETGAWRFETRKLVTAGETRCDFPTVAAVPSGYRLTGMCQVEGTKTDQIVKLTFNEANKSMTVRGQPVGPATLIYCGD